MNKAGCVFCRIAAKELPCKILFENDSIVAFNDLKPQAPVHILIIPKRHIEKVSDININDVGLMGELLFVARSLAHKAGLTDTGYRIVLNCGKDAGQEVPHIHLHLLGGRDLSWPPG